MEAWKAQNLQNMQARGAALPQRGGEYSTLTRRQRRADHHTAERSGCAALHKSQPGNTSGVVWRDISATDAMASLNVADGVAVVTLDNPPVNALTPSGAGLRKTQTRRRCAATACAAAAAAAAACLSVQPLTNLTS